MAWKEYTVAYREQGNLNAPIHYLNVEATDDDMAEMLAYMDTPEDTTIVGIFQENS